jgi:cell wall-associated NlpC family hydrolase
MSKQVILNYVYSFLGTPYRWGGDDPIVGIDCSGLVIEVLKAAGVFRKPYDNTAQGLFRDLSLAGAQLTKQPEELCLAFYGKSDKEINHVGICVSPTQIIEAGGGGSKVIDIKTAADANAYVRVRPIDHRSDIVGILKPIYPWSK